MAIRAGFGIFYDFPNFSYYEFGSQEPYGGAVNNPSLGTGGLGTTTCLSDPWVTLPGAPNPFTFVDQQGVTHTGHIRSLGAGNPGLRWNRAEERCLFAKRIGVDLPRE